MKSTKKTSSPKTAFKLHQEIVYPLQGVGKITSIEEKKFKDDMLLYYIIYLEVSDMTVMIPVDKAEEIGIRAIVSKSESQKALKLITEDYEPVSSDWKMRYQMNLDLLKSGSVMDIATVVRTLYHRSKIKELPILERKLFDSALKLLVDEISFSLEKPKDEVEALIFSKLETE
jgi:CarD family transcriptional regulator